jgi:hypothetical protein
MLANFGRARGSAHVEALAMQRRAVVARSGRLYKTTQNRLKIPARKTRTAKRIRWAQRLAAKLAQLV